MRYDVVLPEIVALIDLNENNVPLEGEYKSRSSFFQEINALNNVLLEENVLVLVYKLRLEQRAYPGHELVSLVSQKVYRLVAMAIDLHGHPLSQFLR